MLLHELMLTNGKKMFLRHLEFLFFAVNKGSCELDRLKRSDSNESIRVLDGEVIYSKLILNPLVLDCKY